MGLATYAYNRSTSGGEIITNLINASDGAGLHFDGTDGTIDIASPPDLGTKFSFEFIIQADSFGSANRWIVDFGNGGRFIFGSDSSTSYNLGIYDNASWKTLGVKVLDDLKVHHLTLTVDGTSAILYDNSNQVGTATISSGHNLDSCSDAKISGAYTGGSNEFNGTIYRARFFNRVLSSEDVTSVYESASIDYADQWGSQTNKITAAVGKNWGTNQADSGNDVNDRATFNAAYVWETSSTPYDLSIASNVFKFSTNAADEGIIYPSVLTGGKKYRFTIKTGTITGDAFKVQQYDGSSLLDIGTLAASSTNIFEFTADATTNGNLLLYGSGTGTIQLDASSVSNEIVEIGAVADFDLAYANPTQSTIVQDRAGAADGTAAGGVTQISPIEQLNSKALRVGTSQASPADGELFVSGNAGIGTSTVNRTSNTVALTVGNGTADNHRSALELVGSEVTSNDPVGTIAFWNVGGSGGQIATIAGHRTDANNSGALLFQTKNAGTNATRLTIDSAGTASITKAQVANDSTPFASAALKLAPSVTTDIKGLTTIALGTSTVENYGYAISAHRSASSGLPSLVFKSHNNSATGLTAMTLDSAGTTSITPTGNVKSLYLVGAPATTNTAFQVEADALTTGRIAHFYSNASGTETRSLVRITNDHASATGVTCLEVANDSGGRAITATGGIVEEGGNLKENVLTNSGFDVWSNSTFENTGSDLIDNGDFASASDWGVSTGAWVIGSGVATFTTGSGTSILSQGSLGTTSGKLYKLTFTVGTATATIAITNASASGTLVAEADYAVGAHTVVYEDVGNNDIAFTSSGGNSYTLDNVSLYEGVPACIAADTKAMDGWYKDSTLDLYREHSGTNTKDGSFYSMRCAVTAANDYVAWPLTGIRQNADWLDRFAGRTVTFGAWFKTSTANHVYFDIYDGTSHTSTKHTGGGDWEWIELTATISATPTYFFVQILGLQSSGDFYVSQPMLVFGNAIGSGNYSRPSGEIVWLEKPIQSTALYTYGFSDVPLTSLNLESDSSGKIPKGAKAIMVNVEMNDSSSSSTDAFFYLTDGSIEAGSWFGCAGLTNDMKSRTNGTQPCSADGDISYRLKATGTGTADLYFKYTGVQLR